MKTNHDTGAWRPLLDATTTPEELDRIIEDEVQLQLADAVMQMSRMDLNDRDKATALVQIERLIRERTTTALVSGWESLQPSAAAGSIH